MRTTGKEFICYTRRKKTSPKDKNITLEKETRITGKELICYTRRKLSHKMKQMSPENKNGCVISLDKNTGCNFELQPHRLKPGMGKRILNGRGTLQEYCDQQSAKHLSSSKLLGKRTCIVHRGSTKAVASDDAIGNKEKPKKRKRKRNNEHDEVSRLHRRAKYLLIKMKSEQNLIDAYSRDGWKGQSREKIKPETELQRAVKQILKCKLGVRDVFHHLAMLSTEGSIKDSQAYLDESFFRKHIFCAKCKRSKVFRNNKVILCAGTCNSGFHQKCVEPPLEKVPPGAEGWLCKFCKCKMEILEVINAHLGTLFTVKNNWEDVFKEAITRSDSENKILNLSEEWPSEDSEDEDFSPERAENSNSRADIEESADDTSSSSLFFSSDEAKTHSNWSEDNSSEGSHNHIKCKTKFDCAGSFISTDSLEASDCEIVSYKRHHKNVDYKKLHDEMFGNEPAENEQEMEDEEWGPQRKKQKKMESDAVTSRVDHRDEVGCSNVISNEKNVRNWKPRSRIPPTAVEKLHQVFSENELPSRAVKQRLSEEFAISLDKIITWFRNARYTALKTRKEDITEQAHNLNITITRRSNNGIEKEKSGEATSMDDSCLLPLSSIINIPRKSKRILRKTSGPPVSIPLSEQDKTATTAFPCYKVKKTGTVFAENQLTVFAENQLTSISVQPNLSQEPDSTNSQQLKSHEHDIERKCHSEETLKTNAMDVSQIDEMVCTDQLCLVEMERLCFLEDRVWKLKKALSEFENAVLLSRKTHLREERVIYVPYAVVKEKERAGDLES